MLNRDNKQVIAPLLITLRVADRRAMTSEAVVSGSIHFRSGKPVGGSSDAPSEEDAMISTETSEGTLREYVDAEAENTPEAAPLL